MSTDDFNGHCADEVLMLKLNVAIQ